MWPDHNPFFISILAIMSIVGIGAGSYPAFMLSSFKPSATLTKHIKAGSKGKMLRNGLVLLGVSSFWQILVIGVVILIAVTLDRWTTRGLRES